MAVLIYLVSKRGDELTLINAIGILRCPTIGFYLPGKRGWDLLFLIKSPVLLSCGIDLRGEEKMTKISKRGLVQVYTGSGKGKTTSALGMVLRAMGHDMRVAVLQFVKSPTSVCGEHRSLQRLGAEVITLGAGFTWVGKNMEKNRDYARELWNVAKEKINSGNYEMLILDEFTYPLKFGWVSMVEVGEVLKNRPPGMHVVITGRDAPQELIDLADTVMEIQPIKHHLDKGIPAQPGIEF
jgi:cob(I)alamin adenosyltransferase